MSGKRRGGGKRGGEREEKLEEEDEDEVSGSTDSLSIPCDSASLSERRSCDWP